MTATTIPAVFSFNSSYDVRVIQIDNDPWFIAADVCEALGLETHVAVRRLDDDEKGRYSTPTLGGEQEMTIINESGLYSLILGSRKPEAKKFKKWVTSEVLPAIRKTGSYSVQAVEPVTTPPKKLTTRSAVDLYFMALRTYAGNSQSKGALWLGLTETVFDKLEISSLDGLTEENVDQAVRIISNDMASDRSGMMAALYYLPKHSVL